jgi:hypothetical protein
MDDHLRSYELDEAAVGYALKHLALDIAALDEAPDDVPEPDDCEVW